MQSFGIDISRWQGNFDFNRAKSEGVQFVILKAGGSDCGLYKDGKYESYYKSCKELGLPVGAYFFGNEKTIENAKISAEYFISLLRGHTFELPIYYDVEASMLSLPKDKLTAIVKTFCKTLKDAGFKTGIYASLSTFRSKFDMAQLDGYSVWIAAWSSQKPLYPCDIWQFGAETNLIRSNKIAGVTCDQDYCYLDIGAPGTPEPTPQKVAMPTIRRGNKGDNVKLLQQNLNDLGIKDGLGLPLVEDGICGACTTAAIQNFQMRVFSDAKEYDGIYGPKTYAKLCKEFNM